MLGRMRTAPRIFRLTWTWIALGIFCPTASIFAAEPAPVEIQIVSPGSDEIVRNRVNVASVRGRALSGSDAPKDFDVMMRQAWRLK